MGAQGLLLLSQRLLFLLDDTAGTKETGASQQQAT